MFPLWQRSGHIFDCFKNSEVFLWFHFLGSNREETSPPNYTARHVNSGVSSAIETDESWLFVSLFVSHLPRSRCMAGTKEFRKNMKMTTPRTVRHFTKRTLSVILCCKKQTKKKNMNNIFRNKTEKMLSISISGNCWSFLFIYSFEKKLW